MSRDDTPAPKLQAACCATLDRVETDGAHRVNLEEKTTMPRQPKFEVYPSADRHEKGKAKPWRWRLRAANGRILGHGGQAFEGRAKAIDAVMRTANAAGLAHGHIVETKS